MDETKYPANAETFNAMFEAFGAVVMALSNSMPPQQREVFARNLARLATAAEKRGNTTLETMLIDLHSAASL